MNYSQKIKKPIMAVDVEADIPLPWVLRDALHLNGTKFGYGIGTREPPADGGKKGFDPSYTRMHRLLSIKTDCKGEQGDG